MLTGLQLLDVNECPICSHCHEYFKLTFLRYILPFLTNYPCLHSALTDLWPLPCQLTPTTTPDFVDGRSGSPQRSPGAHLSYQVRTECTSWSWWLANGLFYSVCVCVCVCCVCSPEFSITFGYIDPNFVNSMFSFIMERIIVLYSLFDNNFVTISVCSFSTSFNTLECLKHARLNVCMIHDHLHHIHLLSIFLAVSIPFTRLHKTTTFTS